MPNFAGGGETLNPYISETAKDSPNKCRMQKKDRNELGIQ